MMPIILLKAHVKGYTRKNGIYVKPYSTKTAGAKQKLTAPQIGLPGAKPAPTSHPKGAKPHPQADDHGERVIIDHPSKPTAPSTWSDPKAAATFVPGGKTPAELNGVPLEPWTDHPQTESGWDYVDGVDDNLDEPPFHVQPGKHASAGVVIEEPDGRVWLTAPTNRFGSYAATFPKGTAEPELSLQATAIKEAYEETGLKVKITGFLGDYRRTTSVARLYRAVRVGGTPAAMGWEAQAVHLVPKAQLYEFLNRDPDHGPAEDIGAGKPPKKPKDDADTGDLFDF